MQTIVPLDEGSATRRRLGPFWIEEGTAVQITGAVTLLVVTALYVLAVVNRPA